jgi:hypothetical protein
MHRRPVRGRRTGLAAAALAVAALTTLGASAPALAAKGGGGGGGKPPSGSTSNSSLKLGTPLVYDANGDGLPNSGDTVRFDVSTTATTQPHVSLKCYQNGALVLTTQTGYYDSYPWPWTQSMNLATDAWTGGAADCTATLYYFVGTKTVYDRTLTVHVDA